MTKGDPSQKDFKRWALWRQAVSIDEIAARWSVSPLEIQLSINKVQEYQHLHSHEAVDMRINRAVLNILNGTGNGPVETILRDLGEAKKMLCSYGPNGEPPVLEPDHDTRIRMIDMLMKMIDKVRPRGAGVNVNVAQTNNTLNVSSPTRSFEERVRLAREKTGLNTAAAELVEDAIDGDSEEDLEDAEYESDENDSEEEGNDVPEPADVVSIDEGKT